VVVRVRGDTGKVYGGGGVGVEAKGDRYEGMARLNEIASDANV